MRACESCHGPGPVLHSNRDQRYLCVKCHENPDDEFFHRQEIDTVMHPFGRCTCAQEGTCEWCKKTEGTILPMFEHHELGWVVLGIVKDRKRYLQSLGPAATPKPGVVEVLDEIEVRYQAKEPEDE